MKDTPPPPPAEDRPVARTAQFVGATVASLLVLGLVDVSAWDLAMGYSQYSTAAPIVARAWEALAVLLTLAALVWVTRLFIAAVRSSTPPAADRPIARTAQFAGAAAASLLVVGPVDVIAWGPPTLVWTWQVLAVLLTPAALVWVTRLFIRSRKLWGLLGALCCLLGAVDLALAGVNPFAPAPVTLMAGSPTSWLGGGDVPVSVCTTQRYGPGTSAYARAWSQGEGTCSQNDVVLSLSDASRAWVTYQALDPGLAEDAVPATVYLRRHDGHWRSFVTCNGRAVCALPLPSLFQAVGLTLRAGMTYDVGAYVHADPAVCYPGCTPALAEPGLPLSFTITAKPGLPLSATITAKPGLPRSVTITAKQRSWFDTHRILTALLVVLVFYSSAGAVVVGSKTTEVPRPIFALAILALALASLAAVLLAPRAQFALASMLEAMRYRVAIGGADLTTHTGPFLLWPEARGATSYRYDITWRDDSASGFYAVSVRNPSTDDARIMAPAYAQFVSAGWSGAPQPAYTGALWQVTEEGTGTCSYAIAGALGRDAFIVSVSGSTCGPVKARALAVEKAVLARL